MADTLIWFRVDRRQFYAIPADTLLPEGDTTIVCENGTRQRVDAGALTGWEVPADEARQRFTGEVEEAWKKLIEGLSATLKVTPPTPAKNPLEALGERLRSTPPDPTLARAGEKLRAALASPDLARALDDVGNKLHEVAQRLREQAPTPTDWELALTQPELLVRYTSGNAFSPSSPVGRCTLTVAHDGTIQVENERGAERRAWHGHLPPEEVARLHATLRAAGTPPTATPPFRPGASLLTLELVSGAERKEYTLEHFSARKVPSWHAVFHLFDSLLLAGSAGEIKLGVGHAEIAIEGVSRV